MKKPFISPTPGAKKRGRPLSFDKEKAVERAMLLFWEHGYEATSLNDLTTALGVTPSSIYTVFGDKKGLFLKTVKRYMGEPMVSESIVKQAASARGAALGLLRAAAIGFTGESTPRGCLLASSAISCSVDASEVRDTLAGIRSKIENRLRDKIKLDIKLGKLPAGMESMALAAHTMAVIQGMSTLARDGATRSSLLRVAELAIKCWPEVRPFI